MLPGHFWPPTSSLTSATSSDDFINIWDQKLWVSPDLDPHSTRPTSEFCGFSHLVADRTPVIGTDFVTNFTTGNGYKFYEDGQVVGKEDGWSTGPSPRCCPPGAGSLSPRAKAER